MFAIAREGALFSIVIVRLDRTIHNSRDVEDQPRGRGILDAPACAGHDGGVCFWTSLRGAIATKQSILPICRAKHGFASARTDACNAARLLPGRLLLALGVEADRAPGESGGVEIALAADALEVQDRAQAARRGLRFEHAGIGLRRR